MKKKLIDILIPTYSREEDIRKNLKLICDMVTSGNLEKNVNVLISDNCSEDNTQKIGCEFADEYDWIEYYRQDKNIGLEGNAVTCLARASSDYVMFLGDDDYLPEGYIEYCIKKIRDTENLHCIIPSFNSSFDSGRIIKRREESFGQKFFKPGIYSCYRLSRFGHQLSGLVLKRRSILQEYLKWETERNLYPFIYWLCSNVLKGKSLYSPKYSVIVKQMNEKDWSYDTSGLLTEVNKNYKILYLNNFINNFQRLMLEVLFLCHNPWRIRPDKLSTLYRANVHIISSDSSSVMFKAILPVISAVLFIIELRK
ncbi:MAG: glycosyltransferase family 2 protein [Balneolaceae bacterium]